MTRDSAEATLAASETGSYERVLRPALVRFTLLSVIAAGLVTLATLVIAERIAMTKALSDAEAQGVGIANRLAAPLVDEEVRAGTPGADEQLATVMANRMRDGSVRHVKLWDESGRVLWSDQPDLLGQTFPISEDVSALFGTRDSVAELTTLDQPEHAAVQGDGELLEVYVGTVDSTGDPLVFEAYLSTQPMEENARTIVRAFVPLLLGSVALLLLVMLPLAVSLARRVERARSERAVMARHALLASDLERRRIAEVLHHGVVQDLSGLVYALPTVSRQLEGESDLEAARSLLDRATDLVQEDVQALRSLMTDIYPPDLDELGLVGALDELVRRDCADAGLVADLHVSEDLTLPPETTQLAFRVVREALRNVVKHAGAERVVVKVVVEGPWVCVDVSDDGRGPGDSPGESPKGHLGLRLLTDTVRDVGGLLVVEPRETGGTRLWARFPQRLLEP